MDKVRFVLQLLAKSRIMLNLILMASKFLTWLWWSAAVSGVILLIGRWSGWLRITIPVWTLISLGGGLAGLGIGWWRRLDNQAVAGWLDENLGSEEILSAALLCIERDCSGSFDERIIDMADNVARMSVQIKWPLRYLLKQASLVAGVIVLATVGLIFVNRISDNRDFSYLKTAGAKKTVEEGSHRNERLVVESPRTLAKMFFPEDARMSMLAERALREGDLPVLQELLKDAELALERQMSDLNNFEKEGRLKKEVRRRQQLMTSLIAASQEIDQGDTTSPEDRETGSFQPDPAGQKKGDFRLSKDFTQRGGSHLNQPSTETETEAEDDSLFDYPNTGGSNAGTGHNPNKGNWGTVTARTGKEETIISRNKESRILEYILPGKNSRLSLTQVIPDSKRSAEAAIFREGIPYDYEEFIRNYFLVLSEETKGAVIKEAQK